MASGHSGHRSDKKHHSSCTQTAKLTRDAAVYVPRTSSPGRYILDRVSHNRMRFSSGSHRNPMSNMGESHKTKDYGRVVNTVSCFSLRARANVQSFVNNSSISQVALTSGGQGFVTTLDGCLRCESVAFYYLCDELG